MNTKNLMPFVGIWVVVLTPVIMIFGVFFSIKNTSGFSSPAPKAVEMSVDSAKKALTLVAQKYNREIYRATDSDRALYNRASAVLEKKRVAMSSAATTVTVVSTPTFFEEGDAAIADFGRTLRKAGDDAVKGVKNFAFSVFAFLVLLFIFLSVKKGIEEKPATATLEAKVDDAVSRKEKPTIRKWIDVGDYTRALPSSEYAMVSIPVLGPLLGAFFLSNKKKAYEFLHTKSVSTSNHDVTGYQLFSQNLATLSSKDKTGTSVMSIASKINDFLQIVATSGTKNFSWEQEEINELSNQLSSLKGVLKGWEETLPQAYLDTIQKTKKAVVFVAEIANDVLVEKKYEDRQTYYGNH